MLKKISQVALAAALMVGLTGCATTWVVLDESNKDVQVSEKVRQLNLVHKAKLQRLAASLTEANVPASGPALNYVSFETFKDQPVITVLTAVTTQYNVQQTSKVARAAAGFSEGVAKVVRAFKPSGILDESGDEFKTIKLGVAYTVADFTIQDALIRALTAKRESVVYLVPVQIAKQYLNQDLSVQELLEQSTVLIDGEKNIIKTQERSIN
jgi:hypothetical protein